MTRDKRNYVVIRDDAVKDICKNFLWVDVENDGALLRTVSVFQLKQALLAAFDRGCDYARQTPQNS